jgi:hypothetical protein
MRRFRLALVLPLLLLFAQHGAVLHELSHMSYTAHTGGAQVQHDEQLLDNSLCPACYSFAQVTSPTTGAAWVLVTVGAPTIKIAALPYRVTAAETLTPRSRGPPQAKA